MAITFTQSDISVTGNAGTARTLIFPGAVAAGSLLVVDVSTYNTGGDVTQTVSDDVNGAYTQSDTYQTRANQRISTWYRANSGAGTPTVTVTPSATCYMTLAIHEYPGVRKTNPLRSTATSQQNNTTPTTDTVTASAGDLLHGAFAHTSTLLTSIVADTGFTDREQELDGTVNQGIATADDVSVTGDTALTWVTNTSVEWVSLGSSFRPQGPNPPNNPGSYSAKAYVLDAEYIESAPAKQPMISVKLLGGSPTAIQPSVARIVMVDREAIERAWQWFQVIPPPQSVVGEAVPISTIPILVDWNPRAEQRTRNHEQLVSAILNSLIMQGNLIRDGTAGGRGVWKASFTVTAPNDWASSVPPTTLAEALNRIATALAALGQKP